MFGKMDVKLGKEEETTLPNLSVRGRTEKTLKTVLARQEKEKKGVPEERGDDATIGQGGGGRDPEVQQK